uniref:Uncharacterized protein n=1 Tax=Romanomermis culicivorax TaxID=13658 RepID=A0A915JC81_ROMCU
MLMASKMDENQASKSNCSTGIAENEIRHATTDKLTNLNDGRKESVIDQKDQDQSSSAECQFVPVPDLDAIQKLLATLDGESVERRIALETMAKLALDSAVDQTEKRYEYLRHRFGTLNRKHEYENYDELCDLGDKIMNGFGIMEDNQIYQIDIKSRVRLTTMVLRAQNEALTYYEKALEEFGQRRDQQLAAEYETLTFWTQFLSKTYMEYHVTWLKCFIDQ